MIVTKQLWKCLLTPRVQKSWAATTVHCHPGSCPYAAISTHSLSTNTVFFNCTVVILFFLQFFSSTYAAAAIHLHYNTIWCIKLSQKAWAGPSFTQHWHSTVSDDEAGSGTMLALPHWCCRCCCCDALTFLLKLYHCHRHLQSLPRDEDDADEDEGGDDDGAAKQ